MTSLEVETSEATPARQGEARPAGRIETGLAQRSPFLHRHGLGLVMALVTSVWLAWGLGHIAFWLDEGATDVALQRTWPQLWTLMHGAEAPLVPYYALLKVFAAVVRHAVPVAAGHPELLLRLPSAIVTVLAVWGLVDWLGRFVPARVVVYSGVLLLLIGGLSRYGQEARPYAPALFAAVVATIVWTTLISDRRRRWIAVYALCVAVMVMLHNLTMGLVAAHLVAAVVAPERGRRRSALVRTLAGAICGLLIVSPLVIATARNGLGASYYPALNAERVSAIFIRLFSFSAHPFLWVGPVILLGLVGLTRVNSEPYRFIARLAAAWALVPVVFLLAAVLIRPNLLFGRYILYVIPAWAILGALGLVTLLDLARSAVGRLPIRSAPALATAVAAVLAVALLAGTAADQWWTLRVIRTAGGHGEDLRPALATANRPEYASLPIVISSQLGASELSAYDRSMEHRVAGLTPQRDQPSIWMTVDPYAARKRFLSKQDRVILFERSRGVEHCEETRPITPAAQLDRCMPPLLRTLGYRVVKVEPSGYGWAFAIVQRPTDQAS